MPRPDPRRSVRVPFWCWALLVGVVARWFSGILVLRAASSQVPVSWTGTPVTYTGMTMMWDGTWYRRIAETGYPLVLPRDPAGVLEQNEWAFYPAFPMACRAIMRVTGLGFREVGGSVALVLGLAATVLVAEYLRRFMTERAAIAATAVWATSFATPVLQLAYTESLAVLLLAAFLLLVDSRRWWGAAAVALLIGLSRPIGVPLVVVAVVAVVWRMRRGPRPLGVGEWTAMLSTIASCGVAGVLWPALAWWRTGVRTAYTDTMATWRNNEPIVAFLPWLKNSRFFFGDLGPWLLAGAVLVLVALLAGPWAWRLPAPAHAWCIAYPLYLGAVLDPISSTFRYLLPLFPLVAVLIGIRRRWSAWQGWLAGVLVVAGCVLQVWWVESFLVFTPPSGWPP